jgi:hypothetical protein
LPASGPTTHKSVVVVLPFAQDWKEPDAAAGEEYGQHVAFAIAAKWAAVAGWQVVDRYSAEDAMRAAKVERGADPNRRELAQLVREALAADAVVFGSVSGAGATKTIRACVVDYRDADGVWPGKLALDKTFKMAYWTDLRFILEDAVASVTGHVFTHPSEDLAILDPASVAAWQANPNLVTNPSFADGKDGRLAAWEAVIEANRYNPAWSAAASAAMQEDRKQMVLWSPAPDDPAAKVLQYAMPESVASANGLACYSEWIEIQPDHRYRCSITYASKGPTFLPFIKGYALINVPGESQPQRREVYRRQFPKLASTDGQWKTSVADFVPSVLPPGRNPRAPYDLKWIRVDLYCYWPVGRLWVKDVTVKLVEAGAASAPAAAAATSRRMTND